MVFSDNQLFYAALYWVAVLPGGAEFVPDLCKQHSKPLMTFESVPCSDGRIIDETTITKQQCEVFLESLCDFMRKNEKMPQYCDDGSRYLELRCGMSDKEDRDFCPALDWALIRSGINQDALSNAGMVYIHGNGQVLASRLVNSKVEIHEMKYPGSPTLDCPSYPHFKSKDMTNCFNALCESIYRVVPLQEGQKYTWSYDNVAGTVSRSEQTAGRSTALLVKSCDAADLKTLTDDDIITANPDKVRVVTERRKERCIPGYVSNIYKVSVEATDDPRIVRELWGPIKCMKATEKMQIHFGSSFVVVNPGDVIIVEKEGYTPRVFRQKDIESGRVVLLDQTPGHALLRGIDKDKKAPSFKLKPW